MLIVKSDGAGLDSAVRTLLSGGVAVIPTDTVYGLAAHPDFPEAVERLYTIKGRDEKKPIALLAADVNAAEAFLGGMGEQAKRVASKYWPGALTLVTKGEGLRVPDHVWTRELLRRCGGVLRVTSANLSGRREATEADSALKDVGLSADLVVDDGLSAGGNASTVVKEENGTLTILREGPIKLLKLASGSPRRAKILSSHQVVFTVAKSDAMEVAYAGDPERTVRENALAKGGRGNILSADTIVWFNDKIYGKPRDLEEAKKFLRELSGKTHTVFTGVAYDGAVKVEKSYVTFHELGEDQIEEYVERVKPTDRAGAYDIDESGDLIVRKYEGEYENIMGLPLKPLREWGIIA